MTPLLLLVAHLILPTPSPRGRVCPATPEPHLLVVPALGLGLLLFLLLGSAAVTTALLLIGGTAWWVVRDIRERGRRGSREKHTAGFLGLLDGELRAGHTIAVAMDHATEALPADTPPELAAALAQVRTRVARGLSGAGALLAGPAELASLGTLWQLSERHGLPLAPLVEQARRRIDTRLRHRAATTATLQGPQATAVILTLLPLAGMAMGTAMGADPLGFLSGGGLGGVLLVTGTALGAGGFLWSRHIIGRAAA
ncbi:type II secretion system F family protein [Corynebacterium nasicanis]|uniref:Type II secretion system F family protein n=1 Tax=Corynebacterium nasicanis TaxID=1448267 RepID=A0ABW1QG76_9CORY